MPLRVLRIVLLLVACVVALPFAAIAQAVTCVPVTTLSTTVTLAWTPRTQPLGVTVTAYVLERQTDTGPWVALTPPSLTQVTATDTGLVAMHTYTYRLSLKGIIPGGILATSGYAEYGTPPPCVSITVVNAPAGLTATPQ